MPVIPRMQILATLLMVSCGLGCGRAAAEGYVSCLDDPEAQLVIGEGKRAPVRPGQSGQLRLTCRRCCWINEDVPGKIVWRLEPAEVGTVEPESGRFTLAVGAAVGSTVVVHAEVTPPTGRKRQAQAELIVIDPAPQPWAGRWREVGRLPCAGAKAAASARAGAPELIEELELYEDGTFSVTWHPFERYKDYWGTYRAARIGGPLRLEVIGGNDVPEGLDLEGTLRLDGGDLVLDGIFLGSKSQETPVVCGHRFRS
jgi:hypothetical protein